MTKIKKEKPNVTIAKVTGVNYDFPNASYDIYLMDKKTYQQLQSLCISESDMPKGLKKGAELILWMSGYNSCKYAAHNNAIIKNKYNKDSLSPATQQHFDAYQEKFNEQQRLKKTLSDINDKAIVVDSIVVPDSNNEILSAKLQLLSYLGTIASETSNKIVSRIKI